MSSIFLSAKRDIVGDSWLDELARASLTAADAKFAADHAAPSFLRVILVGRHEVEARDSYLISKAVQDATAKLGHIIRTPGSEISVAHPADRAKARLLHRGQAGNVMLFGFPETLDVEESYLADTQVETLAERAVRELVNVLPSSPEDDVALDAVLAQRLTVRNAVNDIVNAVPKVGSGLGLQLKPSSGDLVSSIVSAEQANVLKSSLRESRVDKRIITMRGRLDGVRTKRRIFYLEPESGHQEIHGAMDLELLADIRRNLDRQVSVKLQEERTQTLSGKRSHPLYRLLSIASDTDELGLDEPSPSGQ